MFGALLTARVSYKWTLVDGFIDLFLDFCSKRWCCGWQVGCFFMGWVGVVLKKDIAAFSELLVIGLSTGLMGSITTYASWNQELIVLVTRGFWVRSVVGLIIGKCFLL